MVEHSRSEGYEISDGITMIAAEVGEYDTKRGYLELPLSNKIHRLHWKTDIPTTVVPLPLEDRETETRIKCTVPGCKRPLQWKSRGSLANHLKHTHNKSYKGMSNEWGEEVEVQLNADGEPVEKEQNGSSVVTPDKATKDVTLSEDSTVEPDQNTNPQVHIGIGWTECPEHPTPTRSSDTRESNSGKRNIPYLKITGPDTIPSPWYETRDIRKPYSNTVKNQPMNAAVTLPSDFTNPESEFTEWLTEEKDIPNPFTTLEDGSTVNIELNEEENALHVYCQNHYKYRIAQLQEEGKWIEVSIHLEL